MLYIVPKNEKCDGFIQHEYYTHIYIIIFL